MNLGATPGFLVQNGVYMDIYIYICIYIYMCSSLSYSRLDSLVWLTLF